MDIIYDQNQMISQTLDPVSTKLHDIVLRHSKDKFVRIVPITSCDDKGYYVMTELLDPLTVFCASNEIIAKNGQKYYKNSFRIRVPKLINHHAHNHDIISEPSNNTDADANDNNKFHDSFEDIISEEEDISDQYQNIPQEITQEKPQEKTQESLILIDRLNKFQRGLTDRIKYMMMIPDYDNKNSFGLTMNTIKIGNTIKYKNIIEYQNKKNNFCFNVVKQVLMKCRCKLLLKINYLLITETNVILNIRIVRIIPDNLDNLSMSTKINIISEINSLSSRNAEKYNALDTVPKLSHISKNDTKKDLMKLFNLPLNTSAYNKSKSRNMASTIKNVN
jgi:hypothetical protein